MSFHLLTGSTVLALLWLVPVAAPADAPLVAATPPRLRFRDATLSVDEGAGLMLVTLQRLGAATGLATVEVLAADGAAVGGVDYDFTASSVAFADGETEKTVPVMIRQDALDEADEDFQLLLSNPTGASLGDNITLQLTVLDDDPLPALRINDVVVAEDNFTARPAVFTVSLSAVAGRVVTVRYATSDGSARPGSDFIGTNGVLNFAPGQTNAAVTVVLTPDPQREPDQDFFVELTNPVAATVADATGYGQIVELRFTQVVRLGADLRLRFPTGTGASYRVESRLQLSAPIWSPVAGAENVPGTGRPVTVLDLGAGLLPQQFYRVRELP